MPTFQSIGIHPQLRSRLVTQQQHQQLNQHANNTSSNSNNNNNNNNAGNISATVSTTLQAVETPLALLVRHPPSLRLVCDDDNSSSSSSNNNNNNNSIKIHDNKSTTNDENNQSSHCSTKPIALAQVTKLRQEVAHAWIGKTKEGQRIRQIQRVLQEAADNEYKQEFENDENVNRMEMDTDTNHRQYGHGSISSNHRMANTATATTIPGTVSALDLLRFESSSSSSTSSSSSPCLPSRPCPTSTSTGCRALDKLLAFPNQYSYLSTSSLGLEISEQEEQQHYQQQLHPQHNMDLDSDCGGMEVEGNVAVLDELQQEGGVPFGFVTQIIGPPACGKTQLALQLLANHCRKTLRFINHKGNNTNNNNNNNCVTSTTGVINAWFLGRPDVLPACAQRLAQLLSTCSHHQPPPTSGSSSNNNNNVDSTLVPPPPPPSLLSLEQILFLPVSHDYQVLAALSQIEAVLHDQFHEEATQTAKKTIMAPPPGGGVNVTSSSSSSSFSKRFVKPPPAMIVLDSALTTCCLSSSLSFYNNSNNSVEDLGLVHQVGFTLKRLARHYNAAVVLTNGSCTTATATNSSKLSSSIFNYKDGSSGGGGTTGQRIWKSAMDILIRLQALATVDTNTSANRAATATTNVSTAFLGSSACANTILVQASLEKHPTRPTTTDRSLNDHHPQQQQVAQFLIDPTTGIQDVS